MTLRIWRKTSSRSTLARTAWLASCTMAIFWVASSNRSMSPRATGRTMLLPAGRTAVPTAEGGWSFNLVLCTQSLLLKTGRRKGFCELDGGHFLLDRNLIGWSDTIYTTRLIQSGLYQATPQKGYRF